MDLQNMICTYFGLYIKKSHFFKEKEGEGLKQKWAFVGEKGSDELCPKFWSLFLNPSPFWLV